MRFLVSLVSIVLAFTTLVMANIPEVDGVQIEVLAEGKGTREVKKDDKIHMHYRGTLQNGKEFDSSYKRNDPIKFTIGRGQMIKGWDLGLIGTKLGEKRKLTIAPEFAYGDQEFKDRDGTVLIPKKSTLIFETQLVKIEGHKEEL